MNHELYIGISPTLNIRGVLAGKPIKAGEVIEECPLIIYSTKFDDHIEETPLGNYHYVWTGNESCLVLGYGSLYNHSYTPNA